MRDRERNRHISAPRQSDYFAQALDTCAVGHFRTPICEPFFDLIIEKDEHQKNINMFTRIGSENLICEQIGLESDEYILVEEFTSRRVQKMEIYTSVRTSNVQRRSPDLGQGILSKLAIGKAIN